MTVTLPQPRLRPTSPADAAAIVEVFRAVRGAQFAAAALAPDMLSALLDLQFRAQQTQHTASHPNAEDHVIELDEQPVGRCWVDRSPTVIRVLEIAVVPEFQRRGVARRVLADLQDEASAQGAQLLLSVWHDNPAARSLYAGLGFLVTQERADGYLDLCWSTTITKGG